MITFLCILFCLTATQGTRAQPPDSLWTHIYHHSDYDPFGAAIMTSDSGFMIVGGTRSVPDSLSPLWGWMIRTNAEGDTQWTRSFEGTGGASFSRALQLSNGEFVIAGNIWSQARLAWDILLLKTNGSGETIWSRRYIHRDGACQGLEIVADGGFMLAGLGIQWVGGEPDTVDAWLMRTDANGDSLWMHIYNSGFQTAFHSMCRVPGGFVLGGLAIQSDASLWDGWLVKVNLDGDTLWTRQFAGQGGGDDYFNGVIQTSRGELVAVGTTTTLQHIMRVWIVNCDSSGRVEWQRSYGDGAPDQAWSVSEDSHGGFLIGSQYDWRFTVLEVDSDGTLGWIVSPDLNGGAQGGEGVCQTVIPSADGGFVASGSAYVNSINIALTRYGYGMKAPRGDSIVAISQVFVPSVYPNPFNTQLTIEWYQLRPGRVDVVMYDVLGQVVATLRSSTCVPGRQHYAIDGQSLASGTYFISVRPPDYFYRGKVILAK